MSKVSIRFFDEKEVRSIWYEDENKWYFNIVDICAVLTDSKDANAYWRWLKRKLLKENNQTVSGTHAFKFLTIDGKRRKCINTIYSKKYFTNHYMLWLRIGEGQIVPE